MKLIHLSDPHTLLRKPIARTDDILAKQWDKWTQVLFTCRHNYAELIVAGDFFDTPKSWELLLSMSKLIVEWEDVTISSVFGQHDTYLRSRRTRDRTALGILGKLGLINILDDKPRVCRDPNDLPGVYGWATHIYGASDGQPVPEVEQFEKTYNVLVTHKGISDAPLWPGHDCTLAEQFLVDNPSYDLILAGDIHKKFAISVKGPRGPRWILNTGPLVRKTADPHIISHAPCVFLIDTCKREVSEIPIDHDPPEAVLTREHLVDKNIASEASEIVVAPEEDDSEIEISLADAIWEVVSRSNDVPERVLDKLADLISGKPLEV